jgi:hypothetical protein
VLARTKYEISPPKKGACKHAPYETLKAAMSQIYRGIRRFRRWWRGEKNVPRDLHIYFVVHLLIVVWFGFVTYLESHGIHALQYGFLDCYYQGMGIYCLIAPFITVRLFVLASRGGPSFIAFAFADALLSLTHWFAVGIASI